MKKKVLALSLILVIVLVGSANAFSVKSVNSTISLSFSGTTARCNAAITGNSSSDQISATATLYRINSDGSQTLTAEWGSLSGTGSLYIYKTCIVSQGYTYELVVSATVTGAIGTTYPVLTSTKSC